MVITGLSLPTISEPSLALLYGELGMDVVDPTRGTLIARVLECRRTMTPRGSFVGQRAAGRRVAATTPDAVEGAIAFGLASNAIASSGSDTDPAGLGGFVNVPPGVVSIETEVEAGRSRSRTAYRPRSAGIGVSWHAGARGAACRAECASDRGTMLRPRPCSLCPGRVTLS